jgi:nucleotide-binding universal stress UspA family protein
MNIKKILVAVDGSAISLARLETGFNMAKSYGASVTALYVLSIRVPVIATDGVHGGWYMGDDLLANSRTEAHEAAKEVHTACDRLANQYETSVEWVQKEGEVSSVTNMEARFYDILLLGRPNVVNEPQINASEISNILLGCGKPCLVIPGTTPLMELVPRKIVLGWDGSREATQAVAQSMPFLVDAECVMVVTVHKHKERLEDVSDSNQRITAFLKDHKVPASSHLQDKKKHTTAQVLADYAIKSESDLLVIGAYGHSRFREIILGGATKDMLLDATIPVLYAH